MGKKLGVHELAFFERHEAFSEAGKLLRKGFQDGLVAPADEVMQEYMRLLSDTSPHDMGSC
jgi:hypothetical protein